MVVSFFSQIKYYNKHTMLYLAFIFNLMHLEISPRIHTSSSFLSKGAQYSIRKIYEIIKPVSYSQTFRWLQMFAVTIVLYTLCILYFLLYLWDRFLKMGLLEPKGKYTDDFARYCQIPLKLVPLCIPTIIGRKYLFSHSPDNRIYCQTFAFCQSDRLKIVFQYNFNAYFS